MNAHLYPQHTPIPWAASSVSKDCKEHISKPPIKPCPREVGSAPVLKVTGQTLNCKNQFLLLNAPLSKVIGANRNYRERLDFRKERGRVCREAGQLERQASSEQATFPLEHHFFFFLRKKEDSVWAAWLHG